MDQVVAPVRHTLAELLMLSSALKRRRGDVTAARFEALSAQRANVTVDVSSYKLQQVGARHYSTEQRWSFAADPGHGCNGNVTERLLLCDATRPHPQAMSRSRVTDVTAM